MNTELSRIRLAAALVLLGLLVERLTLQWSHPTAFFVYAGVGLLLLGVGVLLFLTTLLGGASAHTSSSQDTAKPATSSDEKTAKA
jgi:hypothetical protein